MSGVQVPPPLPPVATERRRAIAKQSGSSAQRWRRPAGLRPQGDWTDVTDLLRDGLTMGIYPAVVTTLETNDLSPSPKARHLNVIGIVSPEFVNVIGIVSPEFVSRNSEWIASLEERSGRSLAPAKRGRKPKLAEETA